MTARIAGESARLWKKMRAVELTKKVLKEIHDSNRAQLRRAKEMERNVDRDEEELRHDFESRFSIQQNFETEKEDRSRTLRQHQNDLEDKENEHRELHNRVSESIHMNQKLNDELDQLKDDIAEAERKRDDVARQLRDAEDDLKVRFHTIFHSKSFWQSNSTSFLVPFHTNSAKQTVSWATKRTNRACASQRRFQCGGRISRRKESLKKENETQRSIDAKEQAFNELSDDLVKRDWRKLASLTCGRTKPASTSTSSSTFYGVEKT